MKTHSVRKRQTGPIVTLTPKFIQVLSEHSNWVVRVVIFHLLEQITSITGRQAVLDVVSNEFISRMTHNQVDESHQDLRRIYLAGLKNQSLIDIEDLLEKTARFDSLLG